MLPLLIGALVACGPSESAVEEETSSNRIVAGSNKATQQTYGIGVSRQSIQSVYESPDVGFTFESVPLADGRERLMGTSRDGLAFLDLIGPSHNLSKVTVVITVPSDAPDVRLLNAAYLLGLMSLAVPDWADGVDWVNDNFAESAEEGEIVTRYRNREIKLNADPELGMVVLNVEAVGPVATTSSGSVSSTPVPTPFPTIEPTPDVEATKAALNAIDAQRQLEEQATRMAIQAQQEAARHAASLEAMRVANLPTPTPHPATFCEEWEALVLNWIKQGEIYQIKGELLPGTPDHPQLSAKEAHGICRTAFPLGAIGNIPTPVFTWGLPTGGVKVGGGPNQLLPGLYEYRRQGDNRVMPVDARYQCVLTHNYEDHGRSYEKVELPHGEPFTFRFLTSHMQVSLDLTCEGALYRIGD